MFMSAAYAQTATSSAGNAGLASLAQYAPLVLIVIVFYFLLIRPQQKQQKALKAKLGELKRGDKVVTAGGIIGLVKKAAEGTDEIDVEIAPSVTVSVVRSTITTVLQLTTQNDISTTAQKYFDVIRGKTAALFAAAAEVGGVIAGASAEDCAALREFGMDLGMAFQLVDDALDYSADQAELGKTVGDDFREGKLTYPVILALAEANAEERAFWVRTLEESDHAEKSLATALGLIEKYDAPPHRPAYAPSAVSV